MAGLEATRRLMQLTQPVRTLLPHAPQRPGRAAGIMARPTRRRAQPGLQKVAQTCVDTENATSVSKSQKSAM